MLPNKKQLFIRVDANTQIGSGHLIRCLALAQAWRKKGGKVTFISVCESESLRNRIIYEGFELVKIKEPYPNQADFESTLSTINDLPTTKPWVVLDGYHFDTHYQRSIKNNGNPLLIIDDIVHFDHYVADIILNQNIYAGELSYSCEPETKLLLGTDYVLLREEFLAYKNWNRKIPEVAKKILVTMGGGDPNNVTLKVLKALNQVNVEDFKIKVVMGSSYQHLDTLKETAGNCKHSVELLQNVSSMPELMAWADLAVSAGGSTCWELAFMGLPIVLIGTAVNQFGVLKGLIACGIAINLGWHSSVSIEHISNRINNSIIDSVWFKSASIKGKELIDGFGCSKIIMNMSLYCN